MKKWTADEVDTAPMVLSGYVSLKKAERVPRKETVSRQDGETWVRAAKSDPLDVGILAEILGIHLPDEGVEVGQGLLDCQVLEGGRHLVSESITMGKIMWPYPKGVQFFGP